jgi:hypothetical protein
VEADWLRELLMDLPIVEKLLPAIMLNCDNQPVIVEVDSSKDNMKSSRYIKRRLKSIRKMRNSGVITVVMSTLRKIWLIRSPRGCHVM